MPLGAAGAASNEQPAHNSVRKRQAELDSTRLTMSDHMKIPTDEVSLASINVYHPDRFKLASFTNILYKDEISNLRFLLLLQLYEIFLHISENGTELMLSPAADTCSCLDYYNEVVCMDGSSYCCVPASFCKRTQQCLRETSRSMCVATGTISGSVVTREVTLFRRMFNSPQLPNRNFVFWVQQNSYFTTDMEAHTAHVMI